MGITNAHSVRSKFQAVLQEADQDKGDLEDLRKMYTVTTGLGKSAESWKYALWACIGLKIEREINTLCTENPAQTREQHTHQVRMKYYHFKGPTFVLLDLHRRFFRFAKVLGEVLERYGLSALFSDAMCWCELHKLSGNDQKIMKCAQDIGHCERWKSVIPSGDTERLLSLMN